MHDDMDSSKHAELEQIILELENYGHKKSPTQLLEILGKCISLAPAVERLLKIFSEF